MGGYERKWEWVNWRWYYIHLNPVKIIDPKWKENGITDREKAKQYLAEYSYSSYLDYLSTKREEGKILNKETFPQYFENFKEFEQCIDEWIAFVDSPIG